MIKVNLSIASALIFLLGAQCAFSQFDTDFNLTVLNGQNGFTLDGVNASDFSATSVSHAGDVNGDAIADLIIGAPGADPGNNDNAGSSYVVFGTGSGFPTNFDLTTLSGTNGFVINGENQDDLSGIAVSGDGDINDDGIDDLIIGAFTADSGNFDAAGNTYVVFGTDAGFSSTLELSALNGNNGFVIPGLNSFDQIGRSVSHAGDVNNDGIDDLIIGAFTADSGGNFQAGQSFVVFGSDMGFAASLDLTALNGANGFRINGAAGLDQSGLPVSGGGDINGDGFDDVIIGAAEASPGNSLQAGSCFVVFGGDSLAASVNLIAINGVNGFRIDGLASDDRLCQSASFVGDVNGDGLDDLIIGANGSDPGGNAEDGSSYVIFGDVGGFAADYDLSLLNGTNGFVIDGVEAGDNTGFAVSGAGDINGDGVDDLLISSPEAAVAVIIAAAGKSHVIFGSRDGFPANFSLASINDQNGFNIFGENANDNIGQSISHVGDVNNDGVDDLIIGSDTANPGGNTDAGRSYVVFGSDLIFDNVFD